MNRWSGLLRWHRGQMKEGMKKEEEKDGKRAAEVKHRLKLVWKDVVVDPSSDAYFTWIQVMIIPVLYNWVIIICRTCFVAVQNDHLAVWLTLDYLSDLFYIADVIFKFHTGFLEQGILVTDHRRLRKRYLTSSQFFYDVLSLLPTDLLYLRLGLNYPMVRVNRFLRSSRISEAFDRMETRTSYPNTFRIAKLMLYIFVLMHWNACLYFALSSYIGFGADRWVYPNTSIPGYESVRRQYFYSFWFTALIFTTVGDNPMPEREEEYLFATMDLLIAVLVFASIVGNVGTVIINLQSRDNVFFPNHELVNSYLRSQRVSKDLKQRVNNWYQHLHINKKITRENEIMRHLPDRLRTEIAVSVHLGTLSKVTIFQNCEKSLLEELVLKLQPQVYSPGEYVCKKGDVGHEMYIIKEGKLAVVADDGVTQFAVLGEGNFFGEISILNIKGNKSGNRRTANIRSIGHSDLFSLSKEDLTGVLTDFPDAKRLLEEKGRQILMKMGMLEENSAANAESKEKVMKKRVDRIEDNLDDMQTKLARLMAELESNAHKLKARIDQLEKETELWEPGEGEGDMEEDRGDNDNNEEEQEEMKREGSAKQVAGGNPQLSENEQEEEKDSKGEEGSKNDVSVERGGGEGGPGGEESGKSAEKEKSSEPEQGGRAGNMEMVGKARQEGGEEGER
ncbi:cyclic nucleotide-gated channel alpha-4 [Lepisosteus oculatus]|uniref:cyclic nucleotide-gated channel alpha-4 n=1 Tax=Lepisosteus oculatus TaxID=7918 RepID=UPI0035F50D59